MAEDQNLACAPNRGASPLDLEYRGCDSSVHHHVVESLREHCRCEERDRTQRLLTNIDKVVLYWRRDCKNTARAYLVSGTVFHVQLSGAGDDVLRLSRAGSRAQSHRRSLKKRSHRVRHTPQRRQPNGRTHRPLPKLQLAQVCPMQRLNSWSRG